MNRIKNVRGVGVGYFDEDQHATHNPLIHEREILTGGDFLPARLATPPPILHEIISRDPLHFLENFGKYYGLFASKNLKNLKNQI